MAGLTENGLVIRTQTELRALLIEAVLAEVPGLDLSRGPEHQIIGATAEELAIAWEALQAIYSAGYRNTASGLLLDQILALTGTVRRAATRSTVRATVTLNAGVTLPAGSVAAVEDDPDAQFRTTETVSNPGGAPASVFVDMEAVNTGPVQAPAGTLNQIVTTRAGWTAITNASNAEAGRAVADDTEARIQAEIELAGRGSDSYAAIRASLSRVTNVIEVSVYGNETSVVDADGRPAKTFEPVVWDGEGTPADDDAIAQAIWDSKPAGVPSHGSETGNAIDGTGATQAVAFTRAVEVNPAVMTTVIVEEDAGDLSDQIMAAIVARGTSYRVGQNAYASQLICAILAVPGVVAVDSLAIGMAPPPSTVGTVVEVEYNEIVRIEANDDVYISTIEEGDL